MSTMKAFSFFFFLTVLLLSFTTPITSAPLTPAPGEDKIIATFINQHGCPRVAVGMEETPWNGWTEGSNSYAMRDLGLMARYAMVSENHDLLKKVWDCYSIMKTSLLATTTFPIPETNSYMHYAMDYDTNPTTTAGQRYIIPQGYNPLAFSHEHYMLAKSLHDGGVLFNNSTLQAAGADILTKMHGGVNVGFRQEDINGATVGFCSMFDLRGQSGSEVRAYQLIEGLFYNTTTNIDPTVLNILKAIRARLDEGQKNATLGFFTSFVFTYSTPDDTPLGWSVNDNFENYYLADITQIALNHAALVHLLDGVNATTPTYVNTMITTFKELLSEYNGIPCFYNVTGDAPSVPIDLKCVEPYANALELALLLKDKSFAQDMFIAMNALRSTVKTDNTLGSLLTTVQQTDSSSGATSTTLRGYSRTNFAANIAHALFIQSPYFPKVTITATYTNPTTTDNTNNIIPFHPTALTTAEHIHLTLGNAIAVVLTFEPDFQKVYSSLPSALDTAVGFQIHYSSTSNLDMASDDYNTAFDTVSLREILKNMNTTTHQYTHKFKQIVSPSAIVYFYIKVVFDKISHVPNRVQYSPWLIQRPLCHNKCQNGGVCRLTGTCSCPSKSFTGQYCEATYCDTCNGDTTASCDNVAMKCTCKEGWVGEKCETTTQCSLDSSASCRNGGYLPSASTSSPGECITNCICPTTTGWEGARCETCGLVCQNGGTPSTDCTKCNCPQGYQGKLCQCESAQGSVVTTNVNNPTFNEYYLMSRDPGAADTPQSQQTLAKYTNITDAITVGAAGALGVPTEAITVSTAAVTQQNNNAVNFTVNILYSCELNVIGPPILINETLASMAVRWDNIESIFGEIKLLSQSGGAASTTSGQLTVGSGVTEEEETDGGDGGDGGDGKDQNNAASQQHHVLHIVLLAVCAVLCGLVLM